MSQDWDFYFLHVDSKPASIFVDLGLATEAPLERFSYMAYVQLLMNAPRADGLSSREEFDPLKAAEELLERDLAKEGQTIYVGRNTSNGCRDFYFYTANAANWEHQVSRVMQGCDSYQFTCGSRHDPEWETYFGFLYPSEEDRQRIENRRVCDALEKEGDTLSQEREIDHWAYFPTSKARAAFIAGALNLGFQVRTTSDPEKGRDDYSARVYRVDLPSLESIDNVTMPLFKLAKETGGEYDGWETRVVS